MNKKQQFLNAFNKAISFPEDRNMYRELKKYRSRQSRRNIQWRLGIIKKIEITNEACDCKTDVLHYKICCLGEDLDEIICPIVLFTLLERIWLNTNKEHGIKFEEIFVPVSGSIFK